MARPQWSCSTRPTGGSSTRTVVSVRRGGSPTRDRVTRIRVEAGGSDEGAADSVRIRHVDPRGVPGLANRGDRFLALTNPAAPPTAPSAGCGTRPLSDSCEKRSTFGGFDMARYVLVLNHFAVPSGHAGGTRHVELFDQLAGDWQYLWLEQTEVLSRETVPTRRGRLPGSTDDALQRE